MILKKLTFVTVHLVQQRWRLRLKTERQRAFIIIKGMSLDVRLDVNILLI